MQALFELLLTTWSAVVDDDDRAALIHALESGLVLYLPRLSFALTDTERKFLTPDWLAGTRKNISLERDCVQGARGSDAELEQLRALLQRFSDCAGELASALFPRYAPYLQSARTSFRPAAVAQRASSWRKDDARLHVDAFPSRPTGDGARILRIFTNVHPRDEARVWRVGEPFARAAQHFLPRIGRPLPGSARLLVALGITKSARSEYDHIMLRMHDAMKADEHYQRQSQQSEVRFAAGSTWICFSDQVLHAAMSGQHMFEQTLHIPVAAQYYPDLSPLRTLERLRGRALV